MPAGHYPTLSGVINKTRYFNSNKEVVKEEINEYETLIDLANSTPSYYVRNNYYAPIQAPDRLSSYDVIKSLYGSYWIRQKSINTLTYEQGNTLSQKVQNYYGTSANILPAYTIMTDSKNQEIKTETKYPTDLTGSYIYNEMVNRNIITKAVQLNSYSNNNLLTQTTTNYNIWPNNIIAPQSVQQQKRGMD